MTRTERAELVLDIAKRIKAEQASGRVVDPMRLEWADAILAGNTPPEPAQPATGPVLVGEVQGA